MIFPNEVLRRWKDIENDYQHMMTRLIDLCAHPDSTDAQLLKAARLIGDVQRRMTAGANSVIEYLNKNGHVKEANLFHQRLVRK